MAKEDDDWDLERGPRPAGYTPVIAAPPSNIGARPPRPAAGTREDSDDDERKIPSYIWVPLQLLLTAVLCCPVLAPVLTCTDLVPKAVIAGVMLPVVVGMFFFVRAMCKRPRMAVVADVVKG